MTENNLTLPTGDAKKPPKAVLKSNNPFNNISNYSHEARTVPPYVLAGIADNKSDARSEHTLTNDGSRPQSQIHDPFILSMNGNWGTFFETVDSTPAYSEGVLKHDPGALGELPDLSGKWGGDERLKKCLNNEKDYESQLTNGRKWYHLGSGSSDVSSESGNGIKSRSKAKYWMSTEKRDEWRPILDRVFLYNRHVPLFFRIFIALASITALVISINIYQISKKKVLMADDSGLNEVTQQPSTIMAICVQSVALVYLLYITFDEFRSEPLGIRNPIEKLRLILLDLLFIIFSSANLSLSFDTLYDSRWVCSIDEYSRYRKVDAICDKQKALSALLFIILAMWVITFTIRIMRVIQKVSSSGKL